MTANGQQGSVSPMRTDGIDLSALLKAEKATRVDTEPDLFRFWASGKRPAHSNAREIMEVSFGSERLLNHIGFKVSRYPLSMTAEYLTEDGRWEPLRYAMDPEPVVAPLRSPRPTQPVRVTISDSSPSVIRPALDGGDPMHAGDSHWQHESWKTAPVRTSKVRLVLVRNPAGSPPLNVRGEEEPYSVAVGDLSFGYRVLSRYDLPMAADGDWAASGDILGSRVGYGTYDQPPERAVDGSTKTYWRSEPQPFSFSVVNFHLDMRDESGQPQVVDKFWVDPITPGVLCNVYYSNDTEHDYFRGRSTPIDPAHETRYGLPTVRTAGATSTPVAIEFDPAEKVGVAVSGVYTRAAYDRPWWVGIDAQTLVPASDPTEHQMVSLGSTRIVQGDGAIKVVTQSGEQVALALDITQHLSRTRFALAVSYHPADEGSPKNRIRITYQLPGHLPVTTTQDLLAPLPSGGPIGVGLHPDPLNDSGSALSLRGLVVKAETLTPDTEAWFLDEGEEFVADPIALYGDRGTHFNALVRVHPGFITEDNPFGIVGGANDPFDQMSWIPVPGDFVLRQGYMHVPPTKAAFWKFEMTGLLPEVYETFLSMDRDVLVFPHDVVAAYERAAGPASDHSSPAGVQTTGYLEPAVQYSDVRDAIDRSQSGIDFEADATQVLVIRDPVQAERASRSGWVWGYQPWHSGTRAPRFATEGVHRYDRLRIRHTTKVAYFAGIREIEPHRVDYNFPDDTPEYVERFLDTAFIDMDPSETSGVLFSETGGVSSIASTGQVTSGALRSYRNVRGVQFATQESDMIQMFEDPDFNATNMDRWTPFGDAKVNRISAGLVIVNRGWDPNTYGELEQEPYGTYERLEEHTYAGLEGLGPTGAAEGGILSPHYIPFGSGEVMARVHVSAPADLTQPIEVELVSSETGEVWASASRLLKGGESLTISVRAAGSGVMEPRTYGDIETMVTPPTQYGELEDYSYAELESAEGQASSLFVRVVQRGASTDVFRVHRIALYDSPIAWFFSNDDGASFWQAVAVRNDPYAVLTFPEFFDTDDPDMGRTLRWRAKIYRAGATISALHIRPWYGVRGRTIDRAHGMEMLGPNRSLRDLNPATHQHPMWREVFNPIEHVYVTAPTTWRNLMPNPSAEGPVSPSEWEPEGGTIAPALGPLGTGLMSFEFTASDEGVDVQ